MHALLLFSGLAVVVTVTPGPATALVVRTTLRSGRRAALGATLGNSLGVLFWGAASAIGISALVAASELAFLVLKLTGAAVLILLGIQSWRRRALPAARGRSSGRAFRDGALTSFANPKLAIFFIALFPQFLSRGHSTLTAGLAMASIIVVLDLIWYSALAFLINRARAAVEQHWSRRLERASGAAMIGLGMRVALESR